MVLTLMVKGVVSIDGLAGRITVELSGMGVSPCSTRAIGYAVSSHTTERK